MYHVAGQLIDVPSSGTRLGDVRRDWSAAYFASRADYNADGIGDACGVDINFSNVGNSTLECAFGVAGEGLGPTVVASGLFDAGSASRLRDARHGTADVAADGRDEIVVVAPSTNPAMAQVDIVGLDADVTVEHTRQQLIWPVSGKIDTLVVGEVHTVAGDADSYPDLLAASGLEILIAKGNPTGFGDFELIGTLPTKFDQGDFSLHALSDGKGVERVVLAYRGTSKMYLWGVRVGSQIHRAHQPWRIGRMPGNVDQWVHNSLTTTDTDGDGIHELSMMYHRYAYPTQGRLWEWELGRNKLDGPQRRRRLLNVTNNTFRVGAV